MGFDFDPGIIQISESMVWGCSFEGAQCLTFHFLHVEAGHNRRQWGANDTAVLLFVENFVLLEVGSG